MLSVLCSIAACGATRSRSGSRELDVVAFCTITADSADSRLSRYVYSFRNGSHSTDTVDCFALQDVGPCNRIDTPAGWMVLRDYQGKPNSVVWASIGYDSSMATDLDFLRSPPDNALAPGATASGFVLVGCGPSTHTRLYASPHRPDVFESEDDIPVGPFTPHATLWDSTASGEIEVPGPIRDSLRMGGLVQISILMTRPGRVRLDVLDSLGIRIATLKNGRSSSGTHSMNWHATNKDGQAIPKSTYSVRLIVEDELIAAHQVALR